MKSAVCSGVTFSSYIRTSILCFAFAAALFLSAPSTCAADTVWQSADSHRDELQVHTPDSTNGLYWFAGTELHNTKLLGTLDGPDFTTDSSTTLHIWAKWNGVADPTLDVVLVGAPSSAVGDPFVSPPIDWNPYAPANQILDIPSWDNYVRLRAAATSSLQEYGINTRAGTVIHHGDKMWTFLYPSFSAPIYDGGANHWVGAHGTMPFLQLCEGDCSSTNPPACVTDCHSSVLFLPGIEASRLYRPAVTGEQKLWEPSNNAQAQELIMNTDGSSLHADVYTRDIIDNAYLRAKGDVYKSFISDMNALVTAGKINEWEPIPYDWRLTLDDILESGKQTGSNISYLEATDTPYIVQELKRLAANSQTGKVTIVAHSNGGLVAKALMIRLGPDAARYVDKLIFVAVPQVGTPQGIAGLLHGSGAALPSEIYTKMDAATARSVGDTMPGLYTLLPSRAYFTTVTTPVVTFSSTTLPTWASKYGAIINSEGTLDQFLSDTTRLVPPVNDLIDPTSLNSNFISESNAVHQALDFWTPPAGVQLIQVAGWGIPSTISGINYASTSKPVFCAAICTSGGLTPTANTTIDGDGTVVVPSALWTSVSAGAQNYWIDLKRYNTDNLSHRLSAVFGLIPFTHGTFFEVRPLRMFVEDIITSTHKPLSNYSYVVDSPPSSTDTRLIYKLHSPLTLDLYDSLGHHTGISTSTGELDEEIPGTYYIEFGDVKYLFTDATSSLRISMSGYATGTFTLEAQELVGDTLIASTTWKDMPTPQQRG
jgi:pimeloyl-ACP methyl ester carboxylesterase